jgi:hypothetical protein
MAVFPKGKNGEFAMPSNAQNSEQRDHRDEPTYWFAVLEIARQLGDFDQAAEANRQLQRLGVRVTYKRRLTPRRVAR